MADQVWYRSLYWRIALGFVVLLAALLATQGFAFLWMTDRVSQFFPGRAPAEFAQSIAADLAGALLENPNIDLDAYLNRRFSSAFRAFGVVMLDGRSVVSRKVEPPPMITRAARGRLLGPDQGRGGDGRGGGGDGRGSRGDGRGPGGDDRGLGGDGRGPGGPGRGPRGYGPPPPDGFGRGRGDGGRGDGGRFDGGRGGPGFEFAPVVVSGNQIGMVAVPTEPPPLFVTLRDLGPALAVVFVVLLGGGTAIAALVVFRPAHRRLRSLQQAAKALGAGQLAVRAVEAGGDEVSSLAHAFNEMATGLETRTAALALADRTRRQLLADISHELTTPLAAIRGYVETLAMPQLDLDDATRVRYLMILGEETERLEHIVGDLLDLARLEGGGGALQRDEVSVVQLFERAMDRHEPVLQEKQVALVLSESADAATVIGDAKRLEQVLQNLVANAIRHTPRGGRITVSADRQGDRVRLAVEDTGAGIPPEHLPHVFDRFYKVDVSRTGTDTPSGSGLGLSIVHAIVERHGGTVTASNAAGGGARFEVLLPHP